MTAHPFNTTRAAEGLDRRRFTVAEIETMVSFGLMEEERFELIGGEVVPMSPKGFAHEIIKSELIRRFVLAAPDDIAVVPVTTFRLSDYTFLETDMLLLDARAGLATGLNALSGPSVLLVVEIADLSLAYDLGRKAAIYASFGVRELWVVDAVHLTVRVFRDPAADAYRQIRDFTSSETVTPLVAPLAFALRLDDLPDVADVI